MAAARRHLLALPEVHTKRTGHRLDAAALKRAFAFACEGESPSHT
jgi:hypothetical protein